MTVRRTRLTMTVANQRLAENVRPRLSVVTKSAEADMPAFVKSVDRRRSSMVEAWARLTSISSAGSVLPVFRSASIKAVGVPRQSEAERCFSLL